MALVTLAEFKKYVGITRGVDLADDDVVQSAIDAATTGINELLERDISIAGAASDRKYATKASPVLFIHDCTTVTKIDDNGVTLAATDYQLEPLNGVGRSGGYRPFSEVRRVTGWYDSCGWAYVTVTATWGWATIPEAIAVACNILAKDILSNRDVSFGIAAFTEYAGIRARANPQVWERIQPYSLRVGIG